MSDEAKDLDVWADHLREFMLGTVATMEEAKRRVWRARDEAKATAAAALAAKHELAAAERDYTDCRGILEQNWAFFRSEYERVKYAPPSEITEAVHGVGYDPKPTQ